MVVKSYLMIMLIGLISVPAAADSDSLADDASTLAQMERVKKQIIETALDLTPGQCEVFWPLYDSYQQALRNIWERRAGLSRVFAKQKEPLSEEAARDWINAYWCLETERIALRRSALEKFSEDLPAQTVLKYLQLEIQIESDFYAALVKYAGATR